MNSTTFAPYHRRPVVYALIVVACYITARHFIYRALPVADFDAWFRRDLIMSVPRLAAFGACLAYIVRNGGWKQWGWDWSVSRAGGAVLALAVAMEILKHRMAGNGSEFGGSSLVLGWLATGPVALFEEAAFRSILFLSLRKKYGPLWAAGISSVLFCVYHIEAQPVGHWGHIFVFGLATCAALEAGVGIWWLVAAHWFVDGVWFHVMSGEGAGWAFIGYRACLLAAAGVSAALLRRRPLTPQHL